jgi:thiol peroxidase
MIERKGIVTINGNPLTLIGNELKPGDKAPGATLLDTSLNPVELSKFKGKVVIISAVPSLDTPVCDIETKRFNQMAADMGKDVVILTVSMDLPFAQKRWCGSEGIENVITLSDHRDAVFGTLYGVLIKELRLLARTIFVIDRAGTITYIQTVKEITKEPDYKEVLAAVRNIVK